MIVAKMLLLAVLLFAGGDEPKVDLSDDRCRPNEQLVADVEGANVHGSCGGEAKLRIFSLSITNGAPADHGALLAFSLGFCGNPVLRAEGPDGWLIKVRPSKVDTEVEWTLLENPVPAGGIPSGETLKGFVVHLRPGWQLSRSSSAQWDKTGAVNGNQKC